jgi:hypothetical protein
MMTSLGCDRWTIGFGKGGITPQKAENPRRAVADFQKADRS